ncbi:hypothetical protein CKY18_01260 [Enterococcus gallinarum]|nr:hypothetical protein CKY18_01260 [Enterococcus gallinarum]
MVSIPFHHIESVTFWQEGTYVFVEFFFEGIFLGKKKKIRGIFFGGGIFINSEEKMLIESNMNILVKKLVSI